MQTRNSSFVDHLVNILSEVDRTDQARCTFHDSVNDKRFTTNWPICIHLKHNIQMNFPGFHSCVSTRLLHHMHTDTIL